MINILIVDDDKEICLFFETILEEMKCSFSSVNRIKDALSMCEKETFDIVLLDIELPDGNGLEIIPLLQNKKNPPEIIIITGTGDIRGAEIAFKHGVWDYIQKPFQLNEVSMPIQRAIQYREEKLTHTQIIPLQRDKIIGSSGAIKKCLDVVGKAASSDASVIVTGETGTGKELFSRAIHENSKRSSKPFIALDCGALTESLIESTLFGHVKGSFTGATSSHSGLIVQAEGGTLMLDEIGDMPLSVQRSFLRTLQEKTVRPVGGSKEIKVDIRLVSATNLDLVQMVKEKRFREDLFYRIKAMEINLPPLRDRENDIDEIVIKKIYELSKYYKIEVKGVSQEFLETLKQNRWPGNIRELMNVLEYSLASAKTDSTLFPVHLPPEYRLSGVYNDFPPLETKNIVDKAFSGNSFPTLNKCRSSLERIYLKKLLEESGGSREKACKLSGMSQARLYALFSKYDLPRFSS